MQLGYKKPVLFERHAVGGEYGAGFKNVGKGRLVTLFLPDKGAVPIIVDGRVLKDEVQAESMGRNLSEGRGQRCISSWVVVSFLQNSTPKSLFLLALIRRGFLITLPPWPSPRGCPTPTPWRDRTFFFSHLITRCDKNWGVSNAQGV